jgi:hypothetical protein
MEGGPITKLRVGKVWRERDRAFKMDYRLVESTEVFKALGQIVESNRRIFVQRDRLSNDFDALFEATLLERDDAQHVQRLEIVGLALQRRIVMSFRLDKLALLMARKALTELMSARRWVETRIPPFVLVASGQCLLLVGYRFDILARGRAT